MGDQIDELKSVFRSLVVSSPTQMNVRSLLRDYRIMIGSPVPMAKFGHRDPVEFLKERFSDCFLFTGQPSNPVLTLIVPKTLKHIDKFVQKQKVSGKLNPKRRSIPEESVNPPKSNLVYATFSQSKTLSSIHELNQSEVKSNISAVPNQATIPQSLSKEPRKTNTATYIIPNRRIISTNNCCVPADISITTTRETSTTPRHIQNGNNHHENTNSHYTRFVEYKKYNNSDTDNLPSDNSNAVKNFFKKRLPVYDSSQDLRQEVSSEKCGKSLPDYDSGRHTASSGLSVKNQQLEQLKLDILELIRKAPDGVWCTDLIRLYREFYKRELNFSRFGYTSIISMVYSLESEVQITRPEPTGDWLLQERARAARAPLALRPRPAALRLRPTIRPAPDLLHADSDDALPGIDYDPDVFPEDCMHFMESIESVSLDDFRPGAMVEVMIGEVYSPSHFWFIRLGDNYHIAMEDMMDEMTHYYNNEGRERVLARGAVRVGHYCSTLYERDWHRSLIVKIVDSDTVKVRHVDYGTVDTTLDPYLYPRFEALESGDTPNYAEISAYLRDGIALDYVHAYRAHVPAVLPAPPPGNEPAPPPGTEPASPPGTEPAPPPEIEPAHTPPSASPEPAPEATPDLPTRIPLYLPSPTTTQISVPSLSQPQSESKEVRTVPSETAGDPECSALAATNLSPDAPAYVPGTPYSVPQHSVPQHSVPQHSVPQHSVPQHSVPLHSLPPHPAPPPTRQAYRAPTGGYGHRPPPPYAGPPAPPPPYSGPPAPGGVTLSMAECETYRVLSHVNPAAAHWFIVGAMGRALAAPPHPVRPPPMGPMPPPPPGPMHPPFRIRPPPGFSP